MVDLLNRIYQIIINIQYILIILINIIKRKGFVKSFFPSIVFLWRSEEEMIILDSQLGRRKRWLPGFQ